MKKAIFSVVSLVLLSSVCFAGRSIETETVIHASPKAVWDVLTDISKYPEWNPFLRISGKMAVNEKLDIEVNGSRFSPKVVVFTPGQELEWQGKLLFSGLFDGTHQFEVLPHKQGTLFKHSEQFSGVLVPLVWYFIRAKTEKGFTDMNNALKKRVEAKV